MIRGLIGSFDLRNSREMRKGDMDLDHCAVRRSWLCARLLAGEND